MNVEKRLFGKLDDGRCANLYTIVNKNGMIVSITDFGGCLVDIVVLDKYGTPKHIVGGYDNLDGYAKQRTFHGALIGRFGNRIANGDFTINGIKYDIAKNENGTTHLHGGNVGFDQVLWNSEIVGNDSVKLTYLSVDGEEGYPGNLNVTVTYTLSEDNELTIHYQATTDKDTLCNMTNHSFFNLGGMDSGDVLDHTLTIESDYITELNPISVPTGKLIAVKGTPFDFNIAKKIGKDINSDDIQIKTGCGYDHNFVLKNDGKFTKVATVQCEKSGISMDVSTNQPGMQLYTANFMEGGMNFTNNVEQVVRHAVCFETQQFPDNPHHDNFASSILKANEKYDTKTSYRFCVHNS